MEDNHIVKVKTSHVKMKISTMLEAEWKLVAEGEPYEGEVELTFKKFDRDQDEAEENERKRKRRNAKY